MASIWQICQYLKHIYPWRQEWITFFRIYLADKLADVENNVSLKIILATLYKMSKDWKQGQLENSSVGSAMWEVLESVLNTARRVANRAETMERRIIFIRRGTTTLPHTDIWAPRQPPIKKQISKYWVPLKKDADKMPPWRAGSGHIVSVQSIPRKDVKSDAFTLGENWAGAREGRELLFTSPL